MLEAKEYKSIGDVPAHTWDSILDANDYFHSHEFILVVEKSKVENAGFRYLLLYDNDTLVATAVLSAFAISLDLFISKNFIVKGIKKLSPGFFTIRLVACGLPASFGQLNVKTVKDCDIKEVSRLINESMRRLATETKARFMAVKEFRLHEMLSFSSFRDLGFFHCNSIPYMNFTVCWKSFDEYLRSLRHSYRRRILLSLKKLDGSKPVIKRISEVDNNSKKASLVLSDPQDCNPEEFYRMYLGVMGRTPTKLETLNKDFFENLLKQNTALHILSIVHGGKNVSSGIIVRQGDTMTFMLAGREKDEDEFDSYFNLVYGIIAFAIESGCKYLKLGQTAYWVKQSVGAVAENEYLYFASTSKFWHAVISKFRNVFFPPLTLKKIHVFRVNSEPDITNPPDGERSNLIVA